MLPRVSDEERLRHKVLISLNADEQYSVLIKEAEARNLAHSVVARLAFEEGLPVVRRKRERGFRRQMEAAEGDDPE